MLYISLINDYVNISVILKGTKVNKTITVEIELIS